MNVNATAKNCSGVTSRAAGNSFVGAFKRVNIDSITVRNSKGGIKIQDGTEDLTINTVVAAGGAYSTNNSGFKVQGSDIDPAKYPKRVTVKSVVVENSGGSGLYLQNARDTHILSYIGRGNSTVGSYSAIWIHGVNVTVDSIKSYNAQTTAITLRGGSVNFKLGDVYILNPGVHDGPQGYEWGINIGDAQGAIGDVIVEDDKAVPTLRRGINVHQAGAVVDIKSLTVTPPGSVCPTICSVSPNVVGGGPV